MTIDEAMQIAFQHHQAGRLTDAEQLYRQVLAIAPWHVDAWHLLGILAGQAGRREAAVELIGKAIQIQPNQPDMHFNLGLVLRELGRLGVEPDPPPG